jgi:hypothetical protein
MNLKKPEAFEVDMGMGGGRPRRLVIKLIKWPL